MEHEDAPGLGEVRTARLVLRRPVPEDAATLHEGVFSDPRTWRLDPVLRAGTAAGIVAAQVERWRAHGLGSWVLSEAGGPDGARPVGLGGCSRPTDLAWNLAFRLAPAVWGRGYGREVAVAGVAAAHQVRPDLPVTAVVAAANAPSRRVLEQSGLFEVRRALDRSGPDPSAAAVLLYADRPLPEDLARALVG